MVIATKCCHGPDGKLPDNFEEALSVELAISLDALRTDYIDLLVLHRDNTDIPVGRIVNRLSAEVAKGSISGYGVSNWDYNRVDEANDYAHATGLPGIAVVSNNLSLAKPTAPFYPGLVSVNANGEEWHKRTGVALLSWSSQARGFFAGSYAPELRKNYDSVTDGFLKRMIEVYCTEENFERLDRANELGARRGYSAVEVALAWAAHKPWVVPVVGPRNVDELRSCARALELEISEEESAWLDLK